jgi:hypothetical protein
VTSAIRSLRISPPATSPDLLLTLSSLAKKKERRQKLSLQIEEEKELKFNRHHGCRADFYQAQPGKPSDLGKVEQLRIKDVTN